VAVVDVYLVCLDRCSLRDVLRERIIHDGIRSYGVYTPIQLRTSTLIIPIVDDMLALRVVV
jgi:hypothetical protein